MSDALKSRNLVYLASGWHRLRAQGPQLLMQHCPKTELIVAASVMHVMRKRASMHAYVGAPQWRGSALQARARPHAWLQRLGGVWNALLPAISCRMGPAMQRMCTVDCERASLEGIRQPSTQQKPFACCRISDNNTHDCVDGSGTTAQIVGSCIAGQQWAELAATLYETRIVINFLRRG